MSRRCLYVFDVDGTLVDSQAHIHAAMTRAFAVEGLEPPELAPVLTIVGLSLQQAMARLAPALPVERQARLVAAYKAGFSTLRAREPAPSYPGAREALARLAAAPGAVPGIATGKSWRGLDHVLGEHGLAVHFSTAQVADDRPSKPDPSMLHAALAETGVTAGQAVMIGDSVFDIEMGRAAGMATIGVGWGYHPVSALEQAGAGAIVADFAGLEAALAGLGLAP